MGIGEKISQVFGKMKMPSRWVDGMLSADEETEVLDLKDGADNIRDLAFYDERADVLHLLSPEAYHFVLPMIMRAYVSAVASNDVEKSSLLSVDSIVDWLGQPVRPELFSDRFVRVWGRISMMELCVVEDWLRYIITHKYNDEYGVRRALMMLQYLKSMKSC